MITLSAYGTIENGKLTLANRRRFEQDLKGFKDCAVELVVKKKNRRTTPQNKYYHGVVVQEVKFGLLEIGYRMNAEETHYFLKQKFNLTQISNQQGEAIDVPKSTTDLNTVEFSDYIERIAQWASEYLGICIPMPNQTLSLNL